MRYQQSRHIEPVHVWSRLSGAWDYVSGCDIATHFVCGMRSGEQLLLGIVDRKDAQIVDNWNPSGCAALAPGASRRGRVRPVASGDFAAARRVQLAQRAWSRRHRNPMYVAGRSPACCSRRWPRWQSVSRAAPRRLRARAVRQSPEHAAVRATAGRARVPAPLWRRVGHGRDGGGNRAESRCRLHGVRAPGRGGRHSVFRRARPRGCSCWSSTRRSWRGTRSTSCSARRGRTWRSSSRRCSGISVIWR